MSRGSVAELANLDRVPEPPHPDRKPACRCGVFVAECEVPVGDDVIAACWICAHDYLEHDREIGPTAALPCACPLSEIYPADVIEARNAAHSASGPS